MTAWKTATHEVSYKSLGSKTTGYRHFWTCSCGSSSSRGYHTDREARRHGAQHQRKPR